MRVSASELKTPVLLYTFVLLLYFYYVRLSAPPSVSSLYLYSQPLIPTAHLFLLTVIPSVSTHVFCPAPVPQWHLSSSPGLYSTLEASPVVLVSVPELRRSSEGGHGNPFQYSCLENPRNRGTWQATVHRLTRRQTKLKLLSMPTSIWHIYMSIPIPRNNLLKIMQQPKLENN